MLTLRFADQQTVQHYPLEIAGQACWEQACHRQGERAWRCSVELPQLPAATIITPSYAMLGQPGYQFQFTLSTHKQNYPLPTVPSSERLADPSDKRIRTAIDCYHTCKEIEPSKLIVTCHAPLAPERYLLTVSVRPAELTPPSGKCFDEIRTKLPPSRSQMLENPRIAKGICSPVSTAMVLGLHKPAVSVGSIISACYDPVTRMYGMWPLAIRSASDLDCLGAVELFSNWDPVIACLDRGIPVVASIRYGKGELPGAPQQATGGHLVVVHGLHGHQVLVNDPAAPNHGTVNRNYPVDAFAAAWFRYRGAAYVLTP